MFRFAIRDVLWLTVVVALSVGWWLDNRRNGFDRVRAAQTEANLREDKFWAEQRAIKLYEQRVQILRAAADRLPPTDFRGVAAEAN
ncbi:MAG TPA: hypothetical protein VFB80_02415 [Pirellulaceae bacterium]|nr:hypothetical protein [Pirellulaceae bacterium]